MAHHAYQPHSHLPNHQANYEVSVSIYNYVPAFRPAPPTGLFDNCPPGYSHCPPFPQPFHPSVPPLYPFYQPRYESVLPRRILRPPPGLGFPEPHAPGFHRAPTAQGRIHPMVRVFLPDNTTALINLQVMHEQLPRTRHYPFNDRLFVDTFLPRWMLTGSGWPQRPPTFNETIRAFFQKMEQYSAPGSREIHLFERLELHTANALAAPGLIESCYAHVYSTLSILDNDCGFGCSDELSEHISGYLEDFFPLCAAMMGISSVVELFLAYGKTYTGSNECLNSLEIIWEELGFEVWDTIKAALCERLPEAGANGNVCRLADGLWAIGVW